MPQTPDAGPVSPARRRLLAALASVAVLPALLRTAPARAASLDDLRRSGAAGERYDGFAVARQPSAQTTVAQVNAERRRIYAERAKQQGVPAVQVGRVYARQIFANAPAGTYFLGEDGRWVRK
jgi:hypothetical protein